MKQSVSDLQLLSQYSPVLWNALGEFHLVRKLPTATKTGLAHQSRSLLPDRCHSADMCGSVLMNSWNAAVAICIICCCCLTSSSQQWYSSVRSTRRDGRDVSNSSSRNATQHPPPRATITLAAWCGLLVGGKAVSVFQRH